MKIFLVRNKIVKFYRRRAQILAKNESYRACNLATHATSKSEL
jgi:hypothetical protein